MDWKGLFSRRKTQGAEHSTLSTTWGNSGLEIKLTHPLSEPTVEALFQAAYSTSSEDSPLAIYLAQLAEEDFVEIGKNQLILPWKKLYQLIESPEHSSLTTMFSLPLVCNLQAVLDCSGTVSDATFSIKIVDWVENGKSSQVDMPKGAVVSVSGEPRLLPASAWGLLDAISSFNDRGNNERAQHHHELAWGRIRILAEKAGSFYKSRYLETTLVLTPEHLRLPMHKTEVAGTRVVTVEPTFDGAPQGWLKAFDEFNSVQEHYDFTRTGSGRVRVVLSEPVRKVLQVIKREMPGRRVAGARAEKFIHNPWAYLGDAADAVIEQEQFDDDRSGAGAITTIFSLSTLYEEARIHDVSLVITEHYADGRAATERRSLTNPSSLLQFIEAFESALNQDREHFAWEEYDLTLDGEATRQLEEARNVWYLWSKQPAERIEFGEIYTLAAYSERIEGIGIAKPIYIPVLERKDKEDSSWTPEDLDPLIAISLPGHDGRVFVPVTKDWIEQFQQKIETAERSGASSISDAALPTELDVEQARKLVDGFNSILANQQSPQTGDGKPSTSTKKKSARETLLLKTNFQSVDYVETRNASLSIPSDTTPTLPACLRPEVNLKTHQQFGVAWFQHLATQQAANVRGALLADDMGLGKTLQLLIFLAWHFEQNGDSKPALILAPKSLVENWQNEIDRFFTPNFPATLVLYGEDLENRKQPKSLIDEQLQEKGVTELLRPDWLGNHKVIISTYEVLTRYEFTFAKQEFFALICDEAQRIKNPAAQVTLAAKKLRIDFRIACTGTPVENTLTDLWCLFDFVQPGLLGSLEEFSRTYRRPIEVDTEEQAEALQKLQNLIAPQVLRRTKADIAADLPRKRFLFSKGPDEYAFSDTNEKMLKVPLSSYQTALYKSGLRRLQEAASEKSGNRRARLSFAALHHMKAVCAEPYSLPGMRFRVDAKGIEQHLDNSAKMNWLLSQLKEIKLSNEKAIVFTELREVQNALGFFLKNRFGLKPFIINGDSQQRQKYIDLFSANTGFDVIILSTLAAGAGLNVTAANHVLHYTRAWNPAKENQATDRAYRIGQTRDVCVYCPTMTSEEFVTFEQRLDALMRQKGSLADATMAGSSALSSMLNGTATDIGYKDLMTDGGCGVEIKARHLTIEDVDHMDGNSFELFCQLLWEKRGYLSAVTTKNRGDGGIDVVAILGREGDLLQCKSSSSNEIGWDAIKELAGGAPRYQAQYSGVKFRRIAVTNKKFNQNARMQAETCRVSLIERAELIDFLNSHPISDLEFQDEIIGLGISR